VLAKNTLASPSTRAIGENAPRGDAMTSDGRAPSQKQDPPRGDARARRRELRAAVPPAAGSGGVAGAASRCCRCLYLSQRLRGLLLRGALCCSLTRRSMMVAVCYMSYPRRQSATAVLTAHAPRSIYCMACKRYASAWKAS
jgi:hypothetical protein